MVVRNPRWYWEANMSENGTARELRKCVSVEVQQPKTFRHQEKPCGEKR